MEGQQARQRLFYRDVHWPAVRRGDCGVEFAMRIVEPGRPLVVKDWSKSAFFGLSPLCTVINARFLPAFSPPQGSRALFSHREVRRLRVVDGDAGRGWLRVALVFFGVGDAYFLGA
jgi:hypothetical protein